MITSDIAHHRTHDETRRGHHTIVKYSQWGNRLEGVDRRKYLKRLRVLGATGARSSNYTLCTLSRGNLLRLGAGGAPVPVDKNAYVPNLGGSNVRPTRSAVKAPHTGNDASKTFQN